LAAGADGVVFDVVGGLRPARRGYEICPRDEIDVSAQRLGHFLPFDVSFRRIPHLWTVVPWSSNFF